MNYTDILIQPVVTEKANALREQNKYVFIVQPTATKTEIKEAVAKLFNVKVVDCTTIKCNGQNEKTSWKTRSHKLIQKGNCTRSCW